MLNKLEKLEDELREAFSAFKIYTNCKYEDFDTDKNQPHFIVSVFKEYNWNEIITLKLYGYNKSVDYGGGHSLSFQSGEFEVTSHEGKYRLDRGDFK